MAPRVLRLDEELRSNTSRITPLVPVPEHMNHAKNKDDASQPSVILYGVGKSHSCDRAPDIQPENLEKLETKRAVSAVRIK